VLLNTTVYVDLGQATVIYILDSDTDVLYLAAAYEAAHFKSLLDWSVRCAALRSARPLGPFLCRSLQRGFL
jgi:hypothetical protein